jgi:hypothetical protein
MRSLTLLFCAGALVANTLGACAQTPPHPVQSFDPALVREQKRRIAAYDSVVRTVNTDSAYRLWQATLTAQDIRTAQLRVDCEYEHLSDRYGQAWYDAIQRMQDTLWKHADPAAVKRMRARSVGESIPIGRDTCAPRPSILAPRWLREWYVPPLPALPPSASDTTTAALLAPRE